MWFFLIKKKIKIHCSWRWACFLLHSGILLIVPHLIFEYNCAIESSLNSGDHVSFMSFDRFLIFWEKATKWGGLSGQNERTTASSFYLKVKRMLKCRPLKDLQFELIDTSRCKWVDGSSTSEVVTKSLINSSTRLNSATAEISP